MANVIIEYTIGHVKKNTTIRNVGSKSALEVKVQWQKKNIKATNVKAWKTGSQY